MISNLLISFVYGQNIMVLSEKDMHTMNMKSCMIRDSVVIGDAELRVQYRFDHCIISDTTLFTWNVIRMVYGDGYSVQTDMKSYWNSRLKTIVANGDNEDYEETLHFSEMSGDMPSNVFLSMLTDHKTGNTEVVCGDFFNSDQPISYQENLSSDIVWSVGSDTTIIHGYQCQSATTYYKGRKWMAWFTTEIPVAAGPWKLCGLPGLIITAKSMDGYFSFSTISVDTENNKMYSYDYGTTKKLKSDKDWIRYQKNCFENPFMVFGKGEECYVIVKKENGSSEFLDESWHIPYLCPIEK